MVVLDVAKCSENQMPSSERDLQKSIAKSTNILL